MEHAAPEWQLSERYRPNLVALDSVATTMDALIWKREFRKQRFSFDHTARIVEAPDYDPPDAKHWDTILDVRNRIAKICGVETNRKRNKDSIGYAIDDKRRTATLPPTSLKTVKVGGKENPLLLGDHEEIESFFLPILRRMDEIIDTMERLLWDKTYPSHAKEIRPSETVRKALLDKSYVVPPDTSLRNTILDTRNLLAASIGISARPIHDFQPFSAPAWYIDSPDPLPPDGKIPAEDFKILPAK